MLEGEAASLVAEAARGTPTANDFWPGRNEIEEK